MPKPITPEMIDAVNTLRVATRYHSVAQSVKDAINVLDNADFFADIDEARECGDTSSPLPEPPCDLDKPCSVHDAPPLDPAEWGDTTREDMARHQGRQGEA